MQASSDFSYRSPNLQSALNNEDQGFAEQEAESLIVPKKENQDECLMEKNIEKKPKIRYRQPKLKLTFISNNKNSRQQLRRSIVQKQDRSSYGRSLDLNKKEVKTNFIQGLLLKCVSKIHRTVVGQNIIIPNFSLNDSKALKAFIMNQGQSIVYESPREVNTHGLIRSFGDSFLQDEINNLMKNRIKDSYILPKRPAKEQNKSRSVQFNSQYESANLQYAAQAGQNQYDLFLKNDTNTHGHQCWFNFQLKNNKQDLSIVTLNICNIKRDLKLFQECQRIYTRTVSPQGEVGQFKPSGSNFQFRINQNNKFTQTRIYKLSFEMELQPQQNYQISLLPSFSYTQMIRDISSFTNRQYVNVQTLTYSLIGLAIPMLTFTINNQSDAHKNVILISCRIHPGETNASFMCRGLMKALSSNTASIKEYLEKTIVKVIPMINPDGVVFGNFRTNFLGIDLNRAFDNEEEVTNPQIVALKELGTRLKKQYGDRFSMFLDLHGHSAQRNIFTYGPDYDSTETNFYQIRLLPKILSSQSRFFKYHSCSFKLEDYKKHTARGYFLNHMNILAYTIQSSYSVFTEEGKSLFMGINEWLQFGQDLCDGLIMLSRLNKLSVIRNRAEIKRILSQADKDQLEIIKKFKKEFKREKEEAPPPKKQSKPLGSQDSDGQNECQDYSRNQREEVTRRVIQNTSPSMMLPRVLKPSIIYPTVTPKLFKIWQQFEVTHLKILYTKRSNKYSGMRMPGNSYIHSLKGIELTRAQTKNLFY